MVPPIISSFTFAEHQVSIFVGIPLLIAGTIGGFLNIIVFLSLRTFRQNSCAFYLTVMSTVNVGQLITGLLSRIMITGFSIDWTQTSVVYCKFRLYLFQTWSLLSCTCLCLATVDQFFATCSHPHWQRWNRIKIACRLLVVFGVIWILQGIPYLIFFNQVQLPSTNKTICTMTNVIFYQYRVYFIGLILSGILPVIITVLLGFMAYRNVQKLIHQTVPLARRELDKQLTVMVLIQIIFNCFTVLPYFILNAIISSVNITEDPINAAKIQLINIITLHLFYFNFGVSINQFDLQSLFFFLQYPFYLYVCASERFRRQLIHVLFDIHLNQWRPQRIVVNQVIPT